MADFGRGIKAGIVAGIIEGIIAVIIIATSFDIIYSEILNTVPPGFTLETYRELLYWSSLVGAVFGGIIGGLIVGVIFAILYDHLPGKTSIHKGILMGLILWGISVVLSFGRILLYSLVLNAVLDIVLFGFLLGVLWDRFGE